MDKWLPMIEPDACTSCVACVDACNPISLEMREGLAVLTSRGACTSCEDCVAACPTGAIVMAWVPFDGDGAVGRWREIY